MKSKFVAPVIVAALVLAGSSAIAQKDKDKNKQKDEKQQPAQSTTTPQPDTKKKEEPAPLFSGKVGLKSSRQDKDVATLGFNGLDEKGMVTKQFLEASPSAADEVKVQMLANYTVDKEELQKFIQEGKLKAENQKLEPSKAQ